MVYDSRNLSYDISFLNNLPQCRCASPCLPYLILERLRESVHFNVLPGLLEAHRLDEDALRQPRHEAAEGRELRSGLRALLWNKEGYRVIKVDAYTKYYL